MTSWHIGRVSFYHSEGPRFESQQCQYLFSLHIFFFIGLMSNYDFSIHIGILKMSTNVAKRTKDFSEHPFLLAVNTFTTRILDFLNFSMCFFVFTEYFSVQLDKVPLK